MTCTAIMTYSLIARTTRWKVYVNMHVLSCHRSYVYRYEVWACCRARVLVYCTRINSVVHVKKRLVEEWYRLATESLSVDWGVRLRACVAENGCHFAHML